MDGSFIKLVGKDTKERIISIQPIVSVIRQDGQWEVVLTRGDNLVLDQGEADKLINRLPGVVPKKPAVAGGF